MTIAQRISVSLTRDSMNKADEIEVILCISKSAIIRSAIRVLHGIITGKYQLYDVESSSFVSTSKEWE